MQKTSQNFVLHTGPTQQQNAQLAQTAQTPQQMQLKSCNLEQMAFRQVSE
jgi:hypothetical protein